MKRFARLRLLLTMAALALVVALVVAVASPYAPVVEPCLEIEAVWAIEDARVESETPLVTALEHDGRALGYDVQSNTFYCTLGLENGDDWPDIRLTAPDAGGVSLCFVDDYAYDWCADAIREGYSYQILAYTDEVYSYANVVFTGLPVISIHTQQELLPHEDIAVSVSVSAAGEAGLTANARAHKRGDTSLRTQRKHGIKVEFTRGADGTRKTERDMPVLGRTDEFILIACSMDKLLIRDKLSWDLWNGIVSADEPFGARQTAYCEVFVGDAYQGVFVMMEPYDYALEIGKLGAEATATDTLYRLAGASVYEFDRPLIQDHLGYYYEQHYAPAGETGHDAIAPYLALIAQEDDAAFCAQAVEMLDIDSVIRYALFVQACGMTDNEHNNLYILAHREESGYRYLFAPWDLDVSWGRDDEENAEVWYAFTVFDRLVELDCGGVVRDRLAAIWQQMRACGFNAEHVERLLTSYSTQLNDSGAFYRDAVRWNRSNSYSENYSTYSYASVRFAMMDARIEEMTGDALRGRRLKINGYTTFDEGPL